MLVLRYGKALEILLYPSDEFGGQELPSEQIPSFVTGKGLPTDGGGCTLMAKVKVNGASSDPLWTFAKDAFPGDVGWNFAAIFVFDKNGVPIGRFGSRELPAVEEAIRKAMAA